MKYLFFMLLVFTATLILFAGGDNDPDWYDYEG